MMFNFNTYLFVRVIIKDVRKNNRCLVLASNVKMSIFDVERERSNVGQEGIGLASLNPTHHTWHAAGSQPI